jgi:heat shock gene repressor HrcA
MSEPRKLEVLRAIVEDYVHSREPVGSKALVERHHLGVSSATIRNDMAALEDEGLITAPHTSAGRIPTDKGYRLFVDQISAVKPLSQAERRAIQTLLEGSDDLDDVLERTVRLLSQLTNQVAVVQYPHLSRAMVRHIEFVLLAPRQVLAVLIADTGKVEQRVIDVGQELSDEAVVGILPADADGHAAGVLRHLAEQAEHDHLFLKRLEDRADAQREVNVGPREVGGAGHDHPLFAGTAGQGIQAAGQRLGGVPACRFSACDYGGQSLR